MSNSELKLKAHLLRRAGFGSTRSELEALSDKSYEEIVEDLLFPERFPDLDEDYVDRYNPDASYRDAHPSNSGKWVWRMINTKRPLEEKMTLFWHHVFATAWYKGEHTPSQLAQVEAFRKDGLSDINTILNDLSKDPAMNYWLDNCENHATQPNENWGRELLELFSMGVGNYSEDDIKNAARAFTGWTFEQPLPLYPYGNYETSFIYNEDDHDNGKKTFLGHTGNFNGEDIIGIICDQTATAKFISRHLYTFFVEDEPQVHTWSIESPRNPKAISQLMEVFTESKGDIKTILRFLFNSDFFKNAMFKKVKNPAELVAGTMKIVGKYSVIPEVGESVATLYSKTSVMGQDLMNPPTVEGWHTGQEWIDGGTLNERVNFAVDQFNDPDAPGIKDILGRLGNQINSRDLLDKCLDLIGPLDVSNDTYQALKKYADAVGDIDLHIEESQKENINKITRMIQLIVSTREYQFA